MKWKDGLRVWRKVRNIGAPQGKFVEMIEEELQEYKDATTVEERIDAIADIIVFATNECEVEGYDVDLVMKQVVKHISARVQDPEQVVDWLNNGPSGKWRKNPNQDPSTLYEPNYSLCKLGASS